MSPPRIVVTGFGQFSALGSDTEAFFQALLDAKSAVTSLPMQVPDLDDPIAASVADWNPLKELGRGGASLAAATQYAHIAARQAFASARLLVDRREDGGVYVGTGFGGLSASEQTYKRVFQSEGARLRPNTIPVGMANAAAAHLSTEFGLAGPNLTFAAACSSATHAVGQAFRTLQHGEAQLMLAGGTDAPLTPIILAAWNALRILAPGAGTPSAACRPFDRDRSGIVVGEGAAFLILETLEHAQRRGATVRGEILGYGMTADAGHLTQPDIRGIKRAMSLAIEEAGIAPSQLDYVNAHGTATLINDRIESQALLALVGDRHAPNLMISSTKAVHGHAMGASGSLELIAVLLALEQGRIPPTANLQNIDPELPPFDYIAGNWRQAPISIAMSNSFAFGGNNAVLVLRRYSD